MISFLEKFSDSLSKLTGISSIPILLTVYTIFAIVVFDLLARGLMFLNVTFNKNDKYVYKFNKKLKIIRIIITTISIILIWDKQIQSYMTFISVVGAATTLALRDIISNFFAGIYIQLYKPFRIEDRIEVNGQIGDVINTNSLYFEILEVSHKNQGEQSTGIIVQIPNSKIFTEQVKNYTKAFKYIWSEIVVKIKYDGDLKKNKKVLYDIVNENDIVKSIPHKMQKELNNAIGDYRIYYNNLDPIIYTELTDECVNLTIRYLAHPKKARNIESQIWNKIYEKALDGKLDLYLLEEIENSQNTNEKKISKK